MKLTLVMFHFVLFSFFCIAQEVAEPYEVGTWQGFHTAAITYTFDDNCTNQLALAVPMFDEYDYKLTMFAVINWGPNWTGLKNAAANGHEIASHTLSHANLNAVDSTTQDRELKNSQNSINTNVTVQKCMTIAYPNCNPGTYSMVGKYYIGARGCQGFIEGKTPRDFMNISSVICGSQGSVKTAANFKTFADNAANTKGWLVYLIHGIDGDGGYSPLPSAELKASLDYLKQNQAKYWVATFGNVIKYVRERNSLSVTEVSSSADSLTIAVTDTMDNTLYNYPVSLRRPLPEGWISSVVMQNGVPVNSSIVEIESIKYIIFDAVPDNGDVILINSESVDVEETGSLLPASFELYQNYPNPFNPETTISYYVPESQNVEIKVFNSLGKEVATLINEIKSPGLHSIKFAGNNLSSGIYFCRLKANDFMQTKKIVLLQ